MKLIFVNNTTLPWEFTLADAPNALTITLPPGLSAHTFTPVVGAWLIFGPAGDGFPHGLSRRFTTAENPDTVIVLYAAELQQPGRELHELIYLDPPVFNE